MEIINSIVISPRVHVADMDLLARIWIPPQLMCRVGLLLPTTYYYHYYYYYDYYYYYYYCYSVFVALPVAQLAERIIRCVFAALHVVQLSESEPSCLTAVWVNSFQSSFRSSPSQPLAFGCHGRDWRAYRAATTNTTKQVSH